MATTDSITALKDADSNAQLTIHYVPIAISVAGDNEIIPGVSHIKLRVLSYLIVANGTVDVEWKSNNTGISGALPLIANTGASSGYNPNGHFQTGKGEALVLNLSATVSVQGHVMCVEVS